MLFPIADGNKGIFGPAYVTWFCSAMGIITKGFMKYEPDSTIYWEYVNDPRPKKRLW